jgi:hypothetical protein
MKGCGKGLGPCKTLCDRFIRWSRLGVFDRIFALADEGPRPQRIMTDVMHLTSRQRSADRRRSPVPATRQFGTMIRNAVSESDGVLQSAGENSHTGLRIRHALERTMPGEEKALDLTNMAFNVHNREYA